MENIDIEKFNKLNIKLEKYKIKEKELFDYYKTTGNGITKFYEMQKKCRKLENEIENLDKSKTLTEEELNYIIFNNSEPIDNCLTDEEIIEYNIIKNKLKNHTYDDKRLNVFTGHIADNLYDQIRDKFQAWLKYGDDVE